MRKVLIVDDDPAAGPALGRLLTQEGYEVRIATSVRAANDAAAAFCPDVLITDWLLQEHQSGIDVARQLQARCPETEVIFLTGYLAEQLEGRLEGLRVVKVLEKPVGLAELLALLSTPSAS